jgi:hypothetical protein
MSISKLSTNGLTGAKYDTVSADNYYMEPIATTLLASSQATISFTNIPQGYKHLQLRFIGRGTDASTGVGLRWRFNGDTSGLMPSHAVYGDGSSATATYYGSNNPMSLGGFTGANSTASVFGAGVLDLLDYASTSKFKTVRLLDGRDVNGSGFIFFESGLYQSTAPVSQIDITCSAGNFAANSRFSLYGIKG